MTIVDTFQETLKDSGYHGHYFMRSAYSEDKLCDEEGWFPCEGPYDEDDCILQHTISPYGSKEARVLFSTWNLDHVIEKSREILPKLIHAASKVPSKKKLNMKYFYSLLFTRENLKLVHITCHKKEEHKSRKCDSNKFYV